ncbi:LPS export ABC transporter permease LptG [Ketobacter alkanivorans]|uniref:LPS export ABC transporter permease LptG n=1 Tax=Ketobacter alkanivorans TaxID=1917421 RepID=A0A2K9LHT7_9GAMM|nr:LPS export ABC transporter permease LptG [Ketobacter alkanivorans]AUM11919.1 LPS export ABC transporter permease LptG [Ketobacter alkanivorans]MCP5016615.1 LPS export ABC transporter permease LptG [Ketobacter sp.]
MRLLDQYVGRTVLISVLMVSFLLIGLDASFAFLAELDDLKSNYQAFEAFMYILLTLPRRVYEFMPVGTLIGSLIGLGTLANTSELTVIRAAGVSIARIVFAATRPIIWLVLVGMILGQFIVPQTEQFAQSEKARNLYLGESIGSRDGYWYREGGQYTHIQVVQPNGVMFGISRFLFDDDNVLIRSDFSERAIYQGDHWVLEKVRQTRISDQSTESEHFQTMRWEDTTITPQVMSVVVLKPDYLSITGLYQYASYLDSQELESSSYFFSFWKKILQPFTTLVMVFIAISFVFGPLRSVTMGQRIMAGVIVGLLFHYAQQLLGHITIIFNLTPFLAAAVPLVASFLLGVYLLKRV